MPQTTTRVTPPPLTGWQPVDDAANIMGGAAAKAALHVVGGSGGLVSMAAQSKLNEAADYKAGKYADAPKPVAERSNPKAPWYGQIYDSVKTALSMPTQEAQEIVRANSAKAAAASEQNWRAIQNKGDAMHDWANDADAKTTDYLNAQGPRMNTSASVLASVGENVVPVLRAAGPLLDAGQAKSMQGGMPALAGDVIARRLLPAAAKPLIKRVTAPMAPAITRAAGSAIARNLTGEAAAEAIKKVLPPTR